MLRTLLESSEIFLFSSSVHRSTISSECIVGGVDICRQTVSKATYTSIHNYAALERLYDWAIILVSGQYMFKCSKI